MAAAPPQLEIDTIRFYRSNAEEDSNQFFPAETLSIGKGSIVYHTKAYTRWEAFASQLQSLLTEPLGIALEAVYLSNLRLEYRDVFRHSPEGPALASTLLRAGSDLLAPHIFSREALFHSHTGFFEDGPDCDQRLIQVNVDANEIIENDVPGRVISIMTAVQDNFHPDLELERSRGSSAAISNFNSMHVRSAEVFRSVISDEIATRVGMIP
ncbi:hypothetical protein ACM41_16690 [Bradyrhizobium sp. CCBAU 21362]|nr:hypothetical protein [Bradyrhizobium sp. CCBAU 21362]